MCRRKVCLLVLFFILNGKGEARTRIKGSFTYIEIVLLLQECNIAKRWLWNKSTILCVIPNDQPSMGLMMQPLLPGGSWIILVQSTHNQNKLVAVHNLYTSQLVKLMLHSKYDRHITNNLALTSKCITNMIHGSL